MSPRLRVTLIVAAAAIAAAGATVAITLATRSRVPQVSSLRPPPLLLDLGLRTDPQARALGRASVLYERGDRAAAGRIFGRYHSLQAQIGAAFADWPGGTLARMRALVARNTRSSIVELNYALALAYGGQAASARGPLEAAAHVQPDTLSAVRADSLLHPRMPPGLPVFVPSFAPPASIARLPAARQFAALARAARRGGAQAKILYGVALERLGRPLSAEREYAAAARIAPRDPDARVAAAVGRFRKDAPQLAFSRLGPLVRVFPHAPTVRFHLGLLLLWLDQVPAAERELRQARAQGPRTPLGEQAAGLLERLRAVRTR